MVSLVNPDPWAPVIGRLFLAFGSIERTTHECLQDWAGKTIHKHVARSGLSARIDLALDLTASQDSQDKTKQDFDVALRKAKDLSKYRNLVAHNPLCLVFFQEEHDPPFVEAIAATSSDRHISLAQLEEVVGRAEECAKELLQSYVAFRVEKFDFEALKHFPGGGSGDA